MIRVFIGWDARETVAYHVLAHSLVTRAQCHVQIAPVGNAVLDPAIWWRGRGNYDSTDFSNARFMVPYLCNFSGYAIFMDCDMLLRGSLRGLLDQVYSDEPRAVWVRKHEHVPKERTKFLGQPQSAYRRKNWSSLMVFDCSHPCVRQLTADYVNRADGLDLHGFAWCPNEFIGALSEEWNHLTGPGLPEPAVDPKLVHYTLGGPWHGYWQDRYAREWKDTLAEMLGAPHNPCAQFEYRGTESLTVDFVPRG